jgi:hypothetical protein
VTVESADCALTAANRRARQDIMNDDGVHMVAALFACKTIQNTKTKWRTAEHQQTSDC